MWGNKSERWVTPRGEAVWSTHPSLSGCVAPSTCLHFAAEAVPHELMNLAVRQWDHNVLQWLSESCRNLTGIQLHHKLHPTFHWTNLTQLHHHRKNWLNFHRIESNLYVYIHSVFLFEDMLNKRKAKEDNVLLRLFLVLICATELKSIFLRLRIQALGVDLPTFMKFNVISATL